MITEKSKKSAKVIGFIIIVLAIVAVVMLISKAINSIKAKEGDAPHDYSKYQEMLVPVVMNDIDEFDDVTKANMSELIEASLWAILKSDINTDDFASEDGNLLIPASAVEKQFITLFGTDVKIKHGTVSTIDFEFEYDSSNQTYKVPITGVVPTYSPKVLDKSEKSNMIILTVAYLSGSEWEQDKDGNFIEPAPSKYVKVSLRRNKDKSYYICAIQPTSEPEAMSK